MTLALVLAAASGYACGSLPFALLVARAFKLQDPRTYGSGNPGATNVMRSGNKLAGRLVFALDCLKGLTPTVAWLAWGSADAAAACAAATVVAHVWNPWLRFRGGRGVATGFGALFGMDWRLGICAAGVWVALYLMTRTVSLASVCAFVAAMLLAFALLPVDALAAAVVPAIAFVIVLRHRQNLKDLLKGKERKL